MKRILIVGGGISGLAAAHRLLELAPALQIILIEASSRLGGTLRTDEREGFLLERGPDSFISEKPQALDLAKRLGLSSHLIETSPIYRRSFLVRAGRLRPVPEGFQLLAPTRMWPFVTTDIFSLAGKFRMAGDLFLPRRNANGTDDESLANFVRRRLGNEALNRMAQPMVGGIYTADPEKLSLRATLPRFLDMERAERSIILAMWRKARQLRKETGNTSGVSGARYSLFMSFARGMQTLVDKLAAELDSRGVSTRLNSTVTSIAYDGKWQLVTSIGSIEADAVCLAVPSYVAGALLSEVDPELSSMLKQIQYSSTATINLAYRRSQIGHPLNGFGFVVPFIEGRSLIACSFSSVKFAQRAPDDSVLLRAFVGGALQPEMLDLTDDDIVGSVKSDLNQLLSIEGEPIFTEVTRWKRSMPQYLVGHLDLVDAIDSKLKMLPRIRLVGNAFRGPGIPDCIKSGETAATQLVEMLSNH
ncbi:MAG TPA: protoporphyrinogen oxidase [Pyrinomonadaceae bacterium]|nr:protoporphyrinogen oxidase [Pyrinomonadaceae bacterium]